MPQDPQRDVRAKLILRDLGGRDTTIDISLAQALDFNAGTINAVAGTVIGEELDEAA